MRFLFMFLISLSNHSRYRYDDLPYVEEILSRNSSDAKCWSSRSDFTTSNAALFDLGMGSGKTRVGVFNKVGT